jgi:hypothetical protein
MEKKVKFLEALQKLLLINPGHMGPGTFGRRAYVLDLMGQIYKMDDSEDMLDWMREIIENYLKGGTWWEVWEPLEEIRRALILERIERQAELPYWERTTQTLFEEVLREFMKKYLLGTQNDKRLARVISTLQLIRKAFKQDGINTLRVLATYMDNPLTKEKFVIQQLKEIINPPEPEPGPLVNDELPF